MSLLPKYLNFTMLSEVFVKLIIVTFRRNLGTSVSAGGHSKPPKVGPGQCSGGTIITVTMFKMCLIYP